MDAALDEAIQYDASLSVNLSADTSVIYYEGNETDGGNDTASRFFVHENQNLEFVTEGNLTNLEWRDVLIEDVWHTVDSIDKIDVMQTQLGTGNHTIWVRAVSSNGISAPMTIPLNIGEALPEKSEETPGFSFVFVVLSLTLVTISRTRRA